MDLVLISTSNVAGGRSEALARMIASVAAIRTARPELTIKLFLLLQEYDVKRCDPITKEYFDLIHVITSDRRLSLSRARNILLEAACLSAITDNSVVAFPDDDCWYPQGIIEGVVSRFVGSPEIDLWFCKYSSKPVPFESKTGRRAKIVDVARHASSNTTVMRGRLVRRLAKFDEELGVGTPRNGAEDTDFAIAGFKISRQSEFLDVPCIGHRDYDKKFRSKYYPAATLVIGRHSHDSLPLKFELIRKFAIGALLVVWRELSLTSYLSTLKDAVNASISTKQAPKFSHLKRNNINKK